MSRIIDILSAIRNGETYDAPAMSRAEAILKSMMKNLINIADFTDTTTNGYYNDHFTNYKVSANETYTLSFTVEGATEPFSVSVGYGDTAYLTEGVWVYNKANGRVSVTFTPTAERLVNGDGLYFRPVRYLGDTISTYTVSDVVLVREYNDEAQSRFEELLLAIKSGETVSGTPQSRIEEILFAIANGTELPSEYFSELEEAFIATADKLKGE